MGQQISIIHDKLKTTNIPIIASNYKIDYSIDKEEMKYAISPHPYNMFRCMSRHHHKCYACHNCYLDHDNSTIKCDRCNKIMCYQCHNNIVQEFEDDDSYDLDLRGNLCKECYIYIYNDYDRIMEELTNDSFDKLQDIKDMITDLIIKKFIDDELPI